MRASAFQEPAVRLNRKIDSVALTVEPIPQRFKTPCYSGAFYLKALHPSPTRLFREVCNGQVRLVLEV